MAADLPTNLEDAWADYARSLARRGRKPTTAHIYRQSFDAFWTWALEHAIPADPSAVDHHTINRWSDALLTTPMRRNGAPTYITDPETGDQVPKLIEPSTRRILWANLRPFFSWWAKEEEVPNPYHRADAPPVPSEPVPVARIDDLRAVLATCSTKDFTDRRDEAILRVFIDTGARRGELVSLTVDDYDRRADLLHLDGKTGKRLVPVSLATGEALARYLRRRSEHPRADLPALWLGSKGPFGESGIAQMLARRCERAGVPKMHPHQLRHTWAHLFRAEGGSEGDLMYLAGWSSTEMAHRYGRSAAGERAQAAARAIGIGDRL
jgi:integrase